MSRELPKAYDPRAIEEKWARYWVEEQLFAVPTEDAAERVQEGGAGRFVMLLPPPNVTGRLHMGHMLNQTEMDVLARWHRMRGEVAVWVPGTDHAGIATQMMVERQLAAEGTTNRLELGRERFTERVWAWKQQYGGAITEQMRRLGVSVDWSREYFTMDEQLSTAVRAAFVRLWNEGLIYRGAYIVNWDPQLQSAVSDLEVDSEERAGKLYHVRYQLADGTGSVVIATTRPETMLGDVAVAVNPADERYRALVGKLLVLPLSGVNGGAERQIPIVADEWANPEFGTGAVKVTPAHDPNDFLIGKRHDLAQMSVMDEFARMRLDGSPYDGLDRFEARARMVADLERLGALVRVEEHLLTLPVSQRTGAVIEPRLSTQWFIAVNKEPAGGGGSMAVKAIEAVRGGSIRFTPENYAKTYFEWMNNLHDWCISRQLWWGHRIPAWHCDRCHEIVVALETPTACPRCGGGELRQETDVLDMWVSSGLLPFTVFGWDGSDRLTPDLAAFYPTDLLVTGFDILFFWVARMVMLGCHLMADVPLADGSRRRLADTVPFRHVYIHGLIRDANRQKMSKTKGNVVDPIEMIERFGTDAVRFTLASMATPGTDIAFSEARTEGNRAFANKIWNAARFLFLQMDRAAEAGYAVSVRAATGEPTVLPEETPLETRWIFSRLHAVCAEVDRALGEYRFDEAASAAYQFFWGELCDWYLELAKLRLDFGEGVERNETTAITLGALVGVFEAALRLLSPFMPFLTEEIWHALYNEAPPAKSIALTRYPRAEEFPEDARAEAAMATLQELVVTVRALRKEGGVPEKEAVPITVFGDNRVVALVDAHVDMLGRMARVSGVEFAGAGLTGAGARAVSSKHGAGLDVAVVYERQVDAAAERERLGKEIAKLEKGAAAAERQLGSEAFVAKAPTHIVEGLKRQAAETGMLLDKARAALRELPQG